MNIYSMEVTTVTCHECGKNFSDKSRFNQHFLQFHKKEESDCHLCDKNFNTAFMFKNHIRKYHGTVNCGVCDKTVAKNELSRHM